MLSNISRRLLCNTALLHKTLPLTRQTNKLIGAQSLLSKRVFSSSHPAIPIREIEVRLDDRTGDWWGIIDGEEVIFPELSATIEWVLSTPVDLHLFEEPPVIKEEPEADEDEPGHQF